jgi:2-oxoglutarate ferredoxin oxidoreductase subunit beta
VKSLKYFKEKYVRNQPSAFCAGCGDGTILNCFIRAIDDLEIQQDKILCVSGIGCAAWIPSPNFKGDTLHTTHGRALAFATGAKVFNSDLKTVVFTGDGDGAGIGGNHLIHAARRNIGITTILVNNQSYAMTGGQIAPTSFHGNKTATSPFGNPENPFDITKLVEAAGATYVARWTTNHVLELTRSIKEAIQHPGFGFIEVLSQCPTQQRRMFGFRDPVHKIPSKILRMLLESTYIRGKTQLDNYVYAIPVGSPEDCIEKIRKNLDIITLSMQIVDHLRFGTVIKLENENIEKLKSSVEKLYCVKKVAGSLEGKTELGIFVKKIKPEFTTSLKNIVDTQGEPL